MKNLRAKLSLVCAVALSTMGKMFRSKVDLAKAEAKLKVEVDKAISVSETELPLIEADMGDTLKHATLARFEVHAKYDKLLKKLEARRQSEIDFIQDVKRTSLKLLEAEKKDITATGEKAKAILENM